MADVFSCAFCEIFKDTSFTEQLSTTPSLETTKSGNEWTQKWAISEVFGVCFTQSARFNKWHMNFLVKRNSVSFFMASTVIWTFLQNAVKGNLKEF